MGKYRKILIAYDGSDSSRNALRQVVKLARAGGSWIKALAVTPPYEGDIDLTGVRDIEAILRGPGERLLKEAESIAQEEGSSVMTNLEQGEPFEKIISVAESENCDLIAMGRKGKGYLERAMLGSVSARVVGHAKKDVLILPRNSRMEFRDVLLATDGSSHSEAAASKAIDFAASYGCSLTVLSVVDVPDEFYAEAPQVVERLIGDAHKTVDAISGAANAAGVKASVLVREGEPYEVITKIAGEMNAGIIFMGSHGRTGLVRLLMGSTAERVIGHSQCPVLITRH